MACTKAWTNPVEFISKIALPLEINFCWQQSPAYFENKHKKGNPSNHAKKGIIDIDGSCVTVIKMMTLSH